MELAIELRRTSNTRPWCPTGIESEYTRLVDDLVRSFRYHPCRCGVRMAVRPSRYNQCGRRIP